MVRHKLSLLRGADAHGVQPDTLTLKFRAPPLQLDEELLAEGSPKTPQERDDGDPLGRGVFQSRPRAVGREEGQDRDHGTMLQVLGFGRDVSSHDLAATIGLRGSEHRRDALPLSSITEPVCCVRQEHADTCRGVLSPHSNPAYFVRAATVMRAD